MLQNSTLTISNQYASATITTQGGQVLSWQVSNQQTGQTNEILYLGSTAKRSGIPLLFPFANQLQDNIFKQSGQMIPSHGFARISEWEVAIHTPDHIILALEHEHLTPEFKIAYPYPFRLELEISLNERELVYNLRVHNSGNNVLPIAPGLHPYFPIIHEHKSKLRIEHLPQFEANHFGWNEELKGDFFDFTGQIIAHFPSGRTISITESTATPDCKYLVIWSQNQDEVDSDFICLEPFYRETNSLNTNPILVQSGSTWEAKWTFNVTF